MTLPKIHNNSSIILQTTIGIGFAISIIAMIINPHYGEISLSILGITLLIMVLISNIIAYFKYKVNNKTLTPLSLISFFTSFSALILSLSLIFKPEYTKTIFSIILGIISISSIIFLIISASAVMKNED